MEKNCMICSKAYKYCPDCERTESYKDVVDTPSCYAVYLTVIEHRDNVIDSNKAIEKLKTVNMTKDNYDKFELRDVIKKMIQNIFDSEVVKEEFISEEPDTKSIKKKNLSTSRNLKI